MKKGVKLYSFLPVLFGFYGISIMNIGIDIRFYVTTWVYMIYIYFFIIPVIFLLYYVIINYLNTKYNFKLIKKDVFKLVFKIGLVGVVIDYIIVLFLLFISFFITQKLNSYINYEKNELVRWWYDVSNSMIGNPFINIYALIIMCLIIFICKYINYRINLKYCMNNIEIEEREKKKLALYTIILTAPYYFLIPTEWFFK